jgi:hypothetical protein
MSGGTRNEQAMTLPALLLAFVALLGVRSPDTRPILAAVETATSDPREAARLVVLAEHESRFREHPNPSSWDARADLAHGPWQLHGAMGLAPLPQQARAELYLIHEGERICPDAPLAPLAGGCHVAAARRMSDKLDERARELLRTTCAAGEPAACQALPSQPTTTTGQ